MPAYIHSDDRRDIVERLVPPLIAHRVLADMASDEPMSTADMRTRANDLIEQIAADGGSTPASVRWAAAAQLRCDGWKVYEVAEHGIASPTLCARASKFYDVPSRTRLRHVGPVTTEHIIDSYSDGKSIDAVSADIDPLLASRNDVRRIIGRHLYAEGELLKDIATTVDAHQNTVLLWTRDMRDETIVPPTYLPLRVYETAIELFGSGEIIDDVIEALDLSLVVEPFTQRLCDMGYRLAE